MPFLDKTGIFPVFKNKNETKKYLEHIKNKNPRIEKILSSGYFDIGYPVEYMKIKKEDLGKRNVKDYKYGTYKILGLKYGGDFYGLKSLIDVADMFSIDRNLDIYGQIDHLYCLCQKEILEDFRGWYDEINQNP